MRLYSEEVIGMKKLIVLVLTFISVLSVVGCNKESEKWDSPPVIMFQDSLYATNPKRIPEFQEIELTEQGIITSFTVDEETPTVDYQASDESLVGCTIYTSEKYPDYIFVLYVDSEGVKHYSSYVKNLE